MMSARCDMQVDIKGFIKVITILSTILELVRMFRIEFLASLCNVKIHLPIPWMDLATPFSPQFVDVWLMDLQLRLYHYSGDQKLIRSVKSMLNDIKMLKCKLIHNNINVSITCS